MIVKQFRFEKMGCALEGGGGPGSGRGPRCRFLRRRGGADAPPGMLAVICGDEVRSTLVASILQRQGRDVRLVVGGMVDWNERGYPVANGD